MAVFMYKCECCKAAVPAMTRRHTLIISKRTKTYPARYREADPNRNKKRKLIDHGGKGWEIRHELKVCPKCADG